MYSHYLDALTICRVHENPSFFITFTCNVKWPEIKNYMERFHELMATDWADIVDSVFERKVQDFIKLLREKKTLWTCDSWYKLSVNMLKSIACLAF